MTTDTPRTAAKPKNLKPINYKTIELHEYINQTN